MTLSKSNSWTVVSQGKSLYTWDINATSQKTATVFDGHSDTVNTVKYSPDGNYIVSCSSDNTVKIWEADTGALIYTLVGHQANVCLTFPPKTVPVAIGVPA